MYFPILINWTSPFTILVLLGGIFQFYSNFKRNFCKQTVENLIRRRILRRLIWFCTVCLCPTKRTLGLYGFIWTMAEGKGIALLYCLRDDLHPSQQCSVMSGRIPVFLGLTRTKHLLKVAKPCLL